MRVIEELPGGAGKKTLKRKDKKPHPKPFATQDSESSPPAGLGERLRQWGQDHDWYQLGHIRNALALKRAFSKSVGAAVDSFLSQGQVRLGLQVKTDFDSLLDRVKRFDVRCRQGCAEEDELAACEHLQEHIHTTIDDLAALLDNRDLTNDSPGTSAPPQSSAVSTAGHDTWMTFGQASDMLAVSKPTLTRWVTGGKLVCNGQTGRGRKLSKISVLFHKQAIEDMDRINDAKDLRREEKRLDTLHRR